jgi:uncharacterized protein YbaP (TraB family)
MKALWTLFLAVILLSCHTSKQTSKTPETAAEATVENALLWTVTGKGLSAPSYVYGTIHMICKEDFMFSSTLQDKFSEATNVYLELDMDDPSMMLKMASLAILKGNTLQDLMTKEEYDMLSRYVKDSLGMPMMLFNRMKPITLMSMLYTRMLPCSSSESYEMKFVELAKASKKEIKGLETVEEQMGVFDKIPDSTEADMILEMIRTMDQQRKDLQVMINAYKNEDLQKLANQMSTSPEWKGFEDVLLVNRNRNWIPTMEAAMQQGTQLFAVGAGHLAGKDGVINLLRKAGYTVTPVKQMFKDTAKK